MPASIVRGRGSRCFSQMAVAETLAAGDVWSLFDVTWASERDGLDAFLGRILDRCAAWFQASGASIFLAQEGSGRFLLTARWGAHAKIPLDAALQRGEGIAGRAVEIGKPMLVGDPARHPELKGLGVRRRKEIGSSMIVPLVSPNWGCVGVLNLARAANQPPFDADELTKTEALARQIALAVANARLIAKTNQMVEESRRLHELFGAVIERAGFGILVVSENGAIVTHNPEAAEVLGSHPNDEVFWETYIDGVPELFREPMRASIRKGLEGRGRRIRVAAAEGERAWSIACTPLDSGGCTVALQELTELERIQREVAKMKRLAEIGQMTAAIAHEIRNPLTGIRSAAQMVQAGPEYAEEFGAIIEDETGKLNSLCDQFLEFARPLTLHLQEATLAEIARGVVERHLYDFRQANVELHLETVEDSPILWLDTRRIEQVVRNLLLNALQACEPGGCVTLKVKKDTVEVQDDGQGMAPETVERLFTPFFTTKAQGTGLGLSSVSKIVDAHGGTIEVQSEPGVGSTFRVRLPNVRGKQS